MHTKRLYKTFIELKTTKRLLISAIGILLPNKTQLHIITLKNRGKGIKTKAVKKIEYFNTNKKAHCNVFLFALSLK